MTGSTSYDEVPYPSYSYAQTHPDRLATLATVFGMKPAPVEGCRVLEIGCASGGNLIPMAYGLPQSRFLGIDLSTRQIEEGQRMIATLGLKNISLKAMDLCDLPVDFGQFDYIIAHGIYSWVPAEVREQLLALVQRSLAPQGVGYISYNTYPGWHTLGMVREMMLYHTREITKPQLRSARARSFLQFLAESVPDRKNGYGSFLKMYASFLNKDQTNQHYRQDALFLHDELEAVNDPVYFYQFIDQAASHDLQYLTEAELRTLPPGEASAPLVEAIGQMANDLIEAEQYLDFIYNRTFRQTLLCHQGIELSRVLRLNYLQIFYLVGQARPVTAEPDLTSDRVEQFQGVSHRDDGPMAFSTGHALTKAALVHLAEIRPAATTFEALVAGARARLSGEIAAHVAAHLPQEVQTLGTNLLGCYTQALVTLHTYLPQLTPVAGDMPMASPVARLLAEERGDNITNLRHERVSLDPLDRYLIRQLDGKRTLADLVDMTLAGPVADGMLKVEPATSSPSAETEPTKPIVARELRQRLAWLARAGLLVH